MKFICTSGSSWVRPYSLHQVLKSTCLEKLFDICSILRKSHSNSPCQNIHQNQNPTVLWLFPVVLLVNALFAGELTILLLTSPLLPAKSYFLVKSSLLIINITISFLQNKHVLFVKSQCLLESPFHLDVAGPLFSQEKTISQGVLLSEISRSPQPFVRWVCERMSDGWWLACWFIRL